MLKFENQNLALADTLRNDRQPYSSLSNPIQPPHRFLIELVYTKSLRCCCLVILRGGLWEIFLLVPFVLRDVCCIASCAYWAITHKDHIS